MKKHKLQFRRFAGFYKKGTLLPHFVEKLKKDYEEGMSGESGVVDSWFDVCEAEYGKIEQPGLVAGEILDQSVSKSDVQ